MMAHKTNKKSLNIILVYFNLKTLFSLLSFDFDWVFALDMLFKCSCCDERFKAFSTLVRFLSIRCMR